jgi:hypothetical protein
MDITSNLDVNNIIFDTPVRRTGLGDIQCEIPIGYRTNEGIVPFLMRLPWASCKDGIQIDTNSGGKWKMRLFFDQEDNKDFCKVWDEKIMPILRIKLSMIKSEIAGSSDLIDPDITTTSFEEFKLRCPNPLYKAINLQGELCDSPPTMWVSVDEDESHFFDKSNDPIEWSHLKKRFIMNLQPVVLIKSIYCSSRRGMNSLIVPLLMIPKSDISTIFPMKITIKSGHVSEVPKESKISTLEDDMYSLDQKYLHKNPRCFSCKKTGLKLLKCGECKTATYCSSECQKQNWKEHKKRCQYLKDMKKSYPAMLNLHNMLHE